MPRGSSTTSNKQRTNSSKNVSKGPVAEDVFPGTGEQQLPLRADSQSSQTSIQSQSARFKKLSFRSGSTNSVIESTPGSVGINSTTGVPYESISTVSKSPISVSYLPPNANSNGPVRNSSVSSGDSSFLPPNLISGPIPPLPQRSYGTGNNGSTTPNTGGVNRGNSGHQSQLKNHSNPQGSSSHITTHNKGSAPHGSNSKGSSRKNSVYSSLPPLPPESREPSISNRQTSHGSGKSVKSVYDPLIPSKSRQSSGYSEDDGVSIYAPSLFSLKSNISAMAQANEFNLEKPEDDETIEAMFLDLMVGTKWLIFPIRKKIFFFDVLFLVFRQNSLFKIPIFI